MKLLLIDLDATLIDLRDFKEHLFTQLEAQCSIPQEKSKSVYESVKLKDRWPKLFLDQLRESYHIPIETLKNIFESCYPKLILNEKIVEYLRKFEGKKYIFSFGTHDFQMRKINQFQLERLVDGIMITLEKKVDYLTKMIENETVVIDSVAYSEVTMIDNSQEVLEDIRARFPWIKTVLVRDMI